MLVVAIVIIVLIVSVVLFIAVHPVFGGKITREQEQSFTQLEHYRDGKFINREPNKTSFSAGEFLSMLKELTASNQNRSPKGQLTVAEVDWNEIYSEEDSLTWFGHSSFLVSINNKKILVDPVLSFRASPVSFVGSKRYTGSLLHIIDKLPLLYAVLITHDHYDHLDYDTMLRLKEKAALFCVPLGVSNHLQRWGIARESIREFNWWDEYELDGVKLAFTPSRHFSGRGLFNRNSTLWGGWVMLGSNTRLYTSGDGGYGQHFKQIQGKYGAFDLVLMEGGQYDHRWQGVHMTPEEAIQASKDVQGKVVMLIHWAAFTLAYHAWTDPIERAQQAASQEAVTLIAPQIGETVSLGGKPPVIKRWWAEH